MAIPSELVYRTDRLKLLSVEFQAISDKADRLHAGYAQLNERANQRDAELKQHVDLTTRALHAYEQMHNELLAKSRAQDQLNNKILAAVNAQNQSGTILQNELDTQRELLTNHSRLASATNQVINDLRTGVDRVRETVDSTRSELQSEVGQMNNSLIETRNTVDGNCRQLRDALIECQNSIQLLQSRPAPTGNVQQFPNFENLFTTHTTDILRSIPEFDTKSNDSVKRFITTTDMLWTALDNNPANIERFNFNVKLKLAKCNQSFLNKIRELQWPDIKSEIVKDYSVNSARDTLAQINTVKQKTGESLFEFANRCKNLLYDMNSFLGANADSGLETIHDRSARKAFENGLLDGNLRNFIKNVATKNLQELIDTTIERYEQNLTVESRRMVCNYCSKSAHTEKECRKKQSDLAKKNRDRTNRDNTNSGNNRENTNRENSNRGNSSQWSNSQNRQSNGSSRNSNQTGNNNGRNSNQNGNNFGRNSGQNGNNFGRSQGGNGRDSNQSGNNTAYTSYPTRVFASTSNTFSPNPYVNMQSDGDQQSAQTHFHSEN
ncbi:uncharacterized membrane protein DDB_G0293934-like [Contarinia nasturtii]|uniref:uncharacterized membrane protein DDB_G0293934-like n=1 Tax=Contarinia nasturtii TaxID=265458 RepID=UPI0012D49266|nr:uncharacterized membrane protein DDB_G0293934-like [Contarinia nasturtii]